VVIPPAYGGTVNVFQGIFGGLSNASLWWTDFLAGNLGIQTPVAMLPAGVGAFAFGPPTIDKQNHPGVVGMSTGTTAAGRVFAITTALGGYNLGAGLTRIGTWLKTSGVLSTALQRYTLRSGLVSINLPNVIIEGCVFEYDDSQNGGRWQAITHDGVETSTDTGVLVAADTWYKLEVEINFNGDSVDFFIDDVLVATNTTNIPGPTSDLFYNTHIMKLIGTLAASMFIDAAYGFQEVSR
jgi:hypothetical protein